MPRDRRRGRIVARLDATMAIPGSTKLQMMASVTETEDQLASESR